jgi:hypothetical protein
MTIRTLVRARNPVWIDDRSIQLLVEFSDPEVVALGEIPFVAHADDCEDYGRDIFTRAKGEEFGPVTLAPVTDQKDELTEMKKSLCRNVDGAAEVARKIDPGLLLTYQSKLEEANRLLGDKSPDPKNYPMLSVTIGIDGDDLDAVGAVVRHKHLEWKEKAANIERIRSFGKAAINNAKTVEEARQATTIANVSFKEGLEE